MVTLSLSEFPDGFQAVIRVRETSLGIEVVRQTSARTLSRTMDSTTAANILEEIQELQKIGQQDQIGDSLYDGNELTLQFDDGTEQRYCYQSDSSGEAYAIWQTLDHLITHP